MNCHEQSHTLVSKNNSEDPQSYFSTLECATAHDSSCFWGASNANYQPRGMMITNSDPYKKSDYTVPVSYSMDSDAFMSSGLNQGPGSSQNS